MSTIRVRRGLEANRLSFTPAVGEPVFTTDTKKLYVGDGSTPGGILVDMNPAIVPDLVQSVAGRTGDVVLTKADVGLSSADNTADANKPVSVATQAALDAKATIAALTAHASNTANPHSTTKAQVGLPDVDNVSAAALRDRSTHTGTQDIASVAGLSASLAGKQPLGSYATTTELTDGLTDKADVVHTHSQADVSGLGVALDAKQDDLVSGTNIKTINGNSILGSGDLTIAGGGGGGAVDSVNGATGVVVLDADDISDAATTNKFATAAEKTKLSGIATGATANDTDANLKNRANHTGTQTAATISDFNSASDARIAAATGSSVASLSGGKVPSSQLPALALTDVFSVASQVAQLALTAEEGDVAIRTDLNKSYIHNGGVAGTMADWSELLTPTDSVLSVNGETGAVTITTDDVSDTAQTNKWATAAEKTKLGFISVTQAVNLDTIESDTATNNAKVSNATHTGDVTGSAALTIANDAVSNAKLANVATATIKGRTTAGTGDPEDLTAAQATALLDTFTSGAKGLVPASGGGTTNFLRADGTFAVPGGGGGGGSPGGSANELQYNDGAGGFAGAANVEVDTGNLKLVSTTDPAAPTGGILLYSKSVAGRNLPKIIGASGIDTILQVGLHGNAIAMVAPASGTTAPTQWGITLTTAATMSVQQTIASANPWLASWRKRFATSTTAGNLSGMRTAYAQWFRGNAAGFGGFFFRTQFGHNINLNGSQTFIGLCASTGALAATAGAVAALINSIGVGYDTTDSSAGNWQLFRNDGSGTATKVDLGANAVRSNVSHGYDLIIFCPPGSATDIFVRIVNIHTGVVVLDTSYNTDIPAVNVGLAFKAEINNGAVAAAANLEVAKVYIESDY